MSNVNIMCTAHHKIRSKLKIRCIQDLLKLSLECEQSWNKSQHFSCWTPSRVFSLWCFWYSYTTWLWCQWCFKGVLSIISKQQCLQKPIETTSQMLISARKISKLLNQIKYTGVIAFPYEVPFLLLTIFYY